MARARSARFQTWIIFAGGVYWLLKVVGVRTPVTGLAATRAAVPAPLGFHSLKGDRAESDGTTATKFMQVLMKSPAYSDMVRHFVVDATMDFAQAMMEVRISILRGDEVSDARLSGLKRSFGEYFELLDASLGARSRLPPGARGELGGRVQQLLLPLILDSPLAARFYLKPRGYAGDYATIQCIYDTEGHRFSWAGVLDWLFAQSPNPQAVKSRRPMIVSEITRLYADGKRGLSVTSLACGPAAELFDAYDALGRPSNLFANLVDIDEQAIKFVAKKLEGGNCSFRAKLHRADLVPIVAGRQELPIPPQDLVYSMGLIDYFPDKFVVKLLDLAHRMLRPGGAVMLGNFHVNNPFRAFLDHVFDWKLIHRDENDMHRLMLKSAFGRKCDEVTVDEGGVQMFATCRKPFECRS